MYISVCQHCLEEALSQQMFASQGDDAHLTQLSRTCRNAHVLIRPSQAFAEPFHFPTSVIFMPCNAVHATRMQAVLVTLTLTPCNAVQSSSRIFWPELCTHVSREKCSSIPFNRTLIIGLYIQHWPIVLALCRRPPCCHITGNVWSLKSVITSLCPRTNFLLTLKQCACPFALTSLFCFPSLFPLIFA